MLLNRLLTNTTVEDQSKLRKFEELPVAESKALLDDNIDTDITEETDETEKQV